MTLKTLIAGVFALTAAAFGVVPTASAAPESAWDATPEARARLISGVSATGVSGSAPLALEIVLKDGWKTYWRAPGPQGYPPRMTWTSSENLKAATIVWPTPERFTILGFDSIGYRNAVVLPLAVAFQDPTKPARLALEVDYLTCAEVCIPQLARLTLALPAGAPEPTVHAFTIDKARGQAPAPAGGGERIDRVWLEGPADRPVLVLEGASAAPIQTADLFVDGLDEYFFGAPALSLGDDGRFQLRATALEAPATPAAPGALARYTLSLNGKGVEAALALSAPGAGAEGLRPVAGGRPASLWLMLGIAALGGLILNVMPCVLPVLAIKLMGALRHRAEGDRAIRRGFAASAAGIIAAFMALAAGAILLQTLGVAVGWGMQFQQPLFVAGMTVVLAVFAANLWGAFEFAAPDAANRAGARLSGSTESLSGSFWSGVLATALATPCSAPFVGAALSFALTRGPLEIVLIFLAMGLGLAAPYLLTALVPSLARLLPKPGAWMGTLRRILSLAVLATAAWLLWVLSRQAGWAAAGVAGLAAVGVVAAIVVFAEGRRWRIAAAAAALGLLAVWGTAAAPVAATGGNIAWVRFDEAALRERVAGGAVVLVDVTADWCVTCKWNKVAVLERDPVAAALADGVVAMQADWTRPDPAITDYLARHGRFGIPFNIVYGPGSSEGLPLPELLNADAVLDALKKAGRQDG